MKIFEKKQIRQKIKEIRQLKQEYLHNHNNIEACQALDCQDGICQLQQKNIAIVKKIKAILRNCQLIQNQDYPSRLFLDHVVYSYIFRKQ